MRAAPTTATTAPMMTPRICFPPKPPSPMPITSASAERIGELRGELPDVETETNSVTEDGEEMVQLLVRPTTDEGRRPIFKLFSPHPAVTGADPSALDTT
jgi:hypothetical protein